MTVSLPAKQFDIADDFNAGLLRRQHGQCGAGWVSGAPGVNISAAKFAQDTFRKSAVTKPARRFGKPVGAVVAAITSAAARFQRVAACEPGSARPNTATVLPVKGSDGINWVQHAIPGATGSNAISSPQLQGGETARPSITR